MTETGRLLLAFLLGAAATVAGSCAAMFLFPLAPWLGEAGCVAGLLAHLQHCKQRRMRAEGAAWLWPAAWRGRCLPAACFREGCCGSVYKALPACSLVHRRGVRTQKQCSLSELQASTCLRSLLALLRPWGVCMARLLPQWRMGSSRHCWIPVKKSEWCMHTHFP